MQELRVNEAGTTRMGDHGLGAHGGSDNREADRVRSNTEDPYRCLRAKLGDNRGKRG
jgi:hypothetical protein